MLSTDVPNPPSVMLRGLSAYSSSHSVHKDKRNLNDTDVVTVELLGKCFWFTLNQ